MNNFIDDIIDNIIIYLKNPKIKNNIINPLIITFQHRIYYYFITIIGLYSLILILQLLILVILIFIKKKND